MAKGDENIDDETRSAPLLIKHIFRKVFLEDWLVKAFALIITLALWVGVTGLSEPSREPISQIPLVLRTAENTVVSNNPLEAINLDVSGDKRRLSQINRSELRVFVNLADVPPGEHLVILTPENVEVPDLPTGVKVERIEPGQITIVLEPLVQKEVPVRIETAGDLLNGFEIYEQIITPPAVRIRGPEAFVNGLTSVATEKIDIEGKNSGFVARQVRLNLANPKSTFLDSTVDVAFRIGETRMERIFLVPLTDESGRRATVVLFGPRSLLIELKPENLEVYFVRNDDDSVTPMLRLPEGLADRVEQRQLRINQ